MNANKLPKWKKFLKWVHESDGGAITIKYAIDAGVAKDAKDFHNLLYILKQKDLIDVGHDDGIYHIYTDENEVEETLGGYYEWDDKTGLQFIFNDDASKKENPLSSKLDELSDELEEKCGDIDELNIELAKKCEVANALAAKVEELKKKLQQSENNAEKLRVELQIANHANSYLQENIDKFRAEVEDLKKRNTYANEVDANVKDAFGNVAKAFTILANII